MATTGALFFVGCMLIPAKEVLNGSSWIDQVSVLAMLVVTVWTFGLDKAMAAGFVSYTVLQAVSGNWKKINIYLFISTLLLIVSIIFNS